MTEEQARVWSAALGALVEHDRDPTPDGACRAEAWIVEALHAGAISGADASALRQRVALRLSEAATRLDD